MTYKFLNIIDYIILGFRHLIYVLEYIYNIISYQSGQSVSLPNKYSTISLISKLINVLCSSPIRYIKCILLIAPRHGFNVLLSACNSFFEHRYLFSSFFKCYYFCVSSCNLSTVTHNNFTTFFKLLALELILFHLHTLPIDSPTSDSIELIDNPDNLAVA